MTKLNNRQRGDLEAESIIGTPSRVALNYAQDGGKDLCVCSPVSIYGEMPRATSVWPSGQQERDRAPQGCGALSRHGGGVEESNKTAFPGESILPSGWAPVTRGLGQEIMIPADR